MTVAAATTHRLWEAIPSLTHHLTDGAGAAGSAIVVLIDGLGAVQLDEFRGHTPFLNQALRNAHPESGTWETVYPTTTAAALTSLGTGRPPGEHGVVGYDVYDPDRDVVINQLGGWDEATVPEVWQPHARLFETLPQPLEAYTVSLPAFETSALTRAGLAGGKFIGASKLAPRFHQATRIAREAPHRLIYLYANELDKIGHQYGPGSDPWVRVLEELDGELARLTRKLSSAPHPVRVVVTADHGMVHIPQDNRIDYSDTDTENPALLKHVAHTAGEPRFVQLHYAPSATEADRVMTEAAWRERFADQAWITTRDEAIESGWFGPAEVVDRDRVAPRIGDLLIASHADIALYDGRTATPISFAMEGHHGSLTEAERLVPWLIVVDD